ncbi:hypothetical protein, partial [Haliangium sp. UPWRP_2]|uniref:hypothetical protein n=1 Tax=Haliangium sp. UPWRP_2 TaxID=1931276 RepID=UPI0011B270DC
MNSWNRGNRSAELHYAIGRALGQRYEEALRIEQSNAHRRLSDDRWQTIEKELLRETLLHLEQSRSVELEAASYLDALIALYERQFDKALKYANLASIQCPWLYEATKLKADILYERWLVASRNGEEGKEEASLLAALKLYDQATTVGRSDVILYEARAAAWHTLLTMRYKQGRPLEELIPSAISACQDTITASPKRPTGYQ